MVIFRGILCWLQPEMSSITGINDWLARPVGVVGLARFALLMATTTKSLCCRLYCTCVDSALAE
jgi:hypothetical protein